MLVDIKPRAVYIYVDPLENKQSMQGVSDAASSAGCVSLSAKPCLRARSIHQ